MGQQAGILSKLQMPGVGGPSPMIAVFWDDLKLTNGGRVPGMIKLKKVLR